MNLRLEQYKQLVSLNKINPYYHVSDLLEDIVKQDISSQKSYTTAGRVMAIRDFGSTVFAVLVYNDTKLQILLHKSHMDKEQITIFRKLISLGDVIACAGKLCRTNSGDLALQATEFIVLVKSWYDLPKQNSITDKEIKYRQRYLDLLANEQARNNVLIRSKTISSIRKFLEKRGFIELETPILQEIPSGASAKAFKTWHEDSKLELNLRIATELPLKIAQIGNLPRVFEIGRIFRNEGTSNKHNPEFTSIEWYESYKDYKHGMALVTELMHYLAAMLGLSNHIIQQEPRIIRMFDLLQQYFCVSEQQLADQAWLTQICVNHNLDLEDNLTVGALQYLVFDKIVADSIYYPTFVTHYPQESSPLAMPNSDDPSLVDRAELFIKHLEICNLYSELNDPLIQLKNMQKQDPDHVHHDYVHALKYGLPPCCGAGIGIDRLIMLLTDCDNIKDVILFPLMKPK